MAKVGHIDIYILQNNQHSLANTPPSPHKNYSFVVRTYKWVLSSMITMLYIRTSRIHSSYEQQKSVPLSSISFPSLSWSSSPQLISVSAGLSSLKLNFPYFFFDLIINGIIFLFYSGVNMVGSTWSTTTIN